MIKGQDALLVVSVGWMSGRATPMHYTHKVRVILYKDENWQFSSLIG